ncbi:serine carboxypeptidase-like 11 isoform X1 [Lycium barbarum]|uniref:serine carboxypeptidase-like 11 isoform X1 n=1 Tax=Lycium barbarum TaxID=112863 RepID=UPI00293E355D|nr:serine carboxypeptidase-like 11 isoform X1 [Lycium barbarum]
MAKTELCYLLLVVVAELCSGSAAAGSQVKFLPGFQGPLPFELETGYVGVGDREDVQLFYYFIKSESNPETDPVLLWITGGPGCSALSGLIYEIGPITFEPVEYNGSLPTMILNPYSWTKVASIIFLDLPVGTGFSYARTPAALQSSNLQASDHAYQFLREWFVDHPEFLRNPLYVGGDSYSGMVVPIITQIIAISKTIFAVLVLCSITFCLVLCFHILWPCDITENEIEIKQCINLKGYLLGNPATFKGENNYGIPFAYGMGLISDELYESLKTNCKGEYLNINPSNTLCLQDVETFHKLLKGINNPHILEPKCKFFSPRPKLLFGQRRSLDEKFHELNNPQQLPALKCRTDWNKLSYHWADDGQVRDALNIRKGTIGKWERCASLQFQKTVMSSIPYHASLSRKGYRSLIYSGDHDKVVTFQSTQAWIKSLNYSIIDDWRPWTVDNQVAGYTRSYSNRMTFATVKGAGHTAPEYKPRQCLAMLKRWMSYQPL